MCLDVHSTNTFLNVLVAEKVVNITDQIHVPVEICILKKCQLFIVQFERSNKAGQHLHLKLI